jgi:hypothetical protein
MKSKENKKQKAFDNDYKKIMKDCTKHNIPFIKDPQWTNRGDFIVKFSLYQESPCSITSTDTLVNI